MIILDLNNMFACAKQWFMIKNLSSDINDHFESSQLLFV